MAEHPAAQVVRDLAPPAGASPIVVFGTGGSGTRAVAAFLSACGVDMGENVNGSGDAIEFSPLLDAHVDAVLEATHRLDYQPEDIEDGLRSKIIGDYRRAAEEHRSSQHSPARWGFKNPRHLFMLPLIAAAFPEAVFVHVVRDGRDMLLSKNRNQPKKHFEALFERPFAGNEADIARFWAKTNLEARTFGERLKDRYVMARIEDLCGAEQGRAIGRLCATLDIPPEAASRAAGLFEPQESFGRGREHSFTGPVGKRILIALQAFGYD